MRFPVEILKGLTLGAPMEMEGLRVYPVLGSAEPPPDLIDLDEAIAGRMVEITEVSEAGSVPELTVVNRSPRRVVIFDGAELIGAKQDRIVNLTIIVAAFRKLVIPVSCVERGRWRQVGRRFASGGFVYPSLRREKSRLVFENLRRGRGFRSDQGGIWSDLAAKSARMGFHSETGAMRDMAEHTVPDPERLADAFPHQTDQVGYLAFIRGGFAGGDVFPSERISKRMFAKLVPSYQLDSLDRAVEFPPIEAAEVLAETAAGDAEAMEGLGEGRTLRFEGPRVEGAVTLLDDRLAHLQVFPRVDRAERTGRGNGPVVY